MRRDEHDRRTAHLALTKECLEERRRLKGRVTHGHEHRAGARIHGTETHADGVCRSALRLLTRYHGTNAHRGLDRLTAKSGDNDGTSDSGIGEGVENMIDHAATGKRMQDLGDAGTHARPLAGGEDDGRGSGQV
jgi:hypothetical protein